MSQKISLMITLVGNKQDQIYCPQEYPMSDFPSYVDDRNRGGEYGATFPFTTVAKS